MGEERILYILCGGRSLRMGRDKTQLKFRGKTFLELIAEKAEPLFENVILLGADRQSSATLMQIPDAFEEVGPLGGILAALQHTKSETIAIVPADLPLISRETLRLLKEAYPFDKKALVAKSTGRIQPLVGVYQTSLTPLLYDYLDSGKRSVMGFLDQFSFETFDVKNEEIHNINTPEQYNQLLNKYL